jgi:energy-coupling factor transporter ATP-binding protein EcfA2
MSTVSINNIQGVKEIEFDIPEDSGGVLVLKGMNGVGKSTVISIVRGLLSGSGRFKPTDGLTRGTADGFSRHVSVVNSTTRYSGESDAASIEGKFDFSDLVHPQQKTPQTRDKVRVKSLLGLMNVEANPALFYELAGGKEAFEEIVDADDLQTDDIVELAGRVSRALHAKGKSLESEAKHAEKEAIGARALAEGVDLNAESDATVLQKRYEEALLYQQRVKSQRLQAEATASKARSARELKEKFEREYRGPTVAEAEQRVTESQQSVDIAAARARELEVALQEAQADLQAKRQKALSADDALTNTKRHFELLAGWEQTILAAQAIDTPSDASLDAAAQAVAEAQEAATTGAVIRKARERLVEGDRLAEKAARASQRAEQMRAAAQGVDGVLAAALPPGPLRINVEGRVVYDSPRGKNVPFDDASNGEKWSIALPYGIASVAGRNGHLAVVQDAWQDLDSAARAQVAKQCADAKVWIITAEVADGELRAEVYGK